MQTLIQTSRRLDSFLQKAAQNFEVFSNIHEWIKKSKTYSGTTLMYIQSGRKVPLDAFLGEFKHSNVVILHI